MRAAFRSVVLITLLASAAFGQTAALSFRPIDAKYSTALDRIIMVSASPNQLHIYNPVTKADTTVALSAAPSAVSVSPDGLFAAVGHNNLITYVNLSNATVTKTFAVTLNVNDLVLAASYIYLLPTMSIQISSGAVTGALSAGNVVPRGVLSPGEQAIYWIPQYSATISRASTATGVLTNPQSASTGGNCYNYNNSSSVWLADSIVYTSCGAAYEASPEMRSVPPLTSFPSISGLAVAPGLRAAIPPAGYTDYNLSPPQLFSDNEVHLLSGLPPLPQGRFVLPDFSSGNNSFVAHGRWLFFDSAGTKIFTVMQADGASGLLNDFAVQTTSLTPGSCSTVLSPAQLPAPGTGTLLATSVTSAGNCAFQITSNVPWIKTVTSYGGGPIIVNLLVRPNTGAARSGTVTIGSDSLTVSQDAAPAASSLTPLSFKVVAAEFSKSQNKLLLAARSPNEFHLINPATLADQIVALSFVPRSVALTPDGTTAAVGGDGAVAFVNVANGAVTGPYRIPSEVTGIILPGNGYAFLYSTRSNPISILISTGVYTVTANPASPPVRLSPGGRYGYSTGYGIYKWDFLTAGTATLVGPVPNQVELGNNTNFWFSEDGSRMFTSSGRAYRTSDNLSTDLIYNGMLADVSFLSWVANSTAVKTTAVTTFAQYSGTDTELLLYGDEFLGLLSKTTHPSLTGASGIAYPSKGRFVFWNAASDKLIVVLQADPQTALTADYAVYVLSAGNCALNSLVSTNAAFAIDGGASQFAIGAPVGCAWKATSNAPWLTINSGGFGISSASVGYTVAANASGATRTGIINVSGLDFTVTQSAGTLTLNPTALSFAGIGGAASVAVTASASTVAWTAQSTVPWLTITSNASGTGSGTVGYAVAGNPFSTSRTGIITIGGVTFTVTQAGSTGAVTFGTTYLNVSGEAGASTMQVISTGSWVAASTVSWLRITSPANGVGTGTRAIDFALDRNPGPGSRYGTIVINGQIIQVYQNEAPPIVTLDPATVSVSASGGPGTIRLTSSSSSYYWYASTNAAWVTIPSPTYGYGTANISYAVAANTSTAARSALIFIGPNSVVVNQVGNVPPPPVTAGLQFVAATPCRIADTREVRSSGLGQPALVGGAVRDFSILAACGIPATARAYSLNITVVPKGPLGYISIWPAGTPQPLVSTLNSLDGRIKANAAIVPAGGGGAVSVFATGATELIIDINGYFVETAALAFYPITPCRIADTRNPNGSLGGPALSNGSRSFPILSSACGIPATAQAYSLNATVVPSGSLGYLTLWAAGQSQPLVSTLNAPRGNIVANAAIVPAGANGAISAYANGTTHLVIDINGYFAPPGAANAMKFFPVTPCRLVDTRNADGPLGGPILPDSGSRSFPLTSANCGIAPTATAFSLNATVVPTTVLGYLTLWPTGQAQPLVSTLNAPEDAIVANAAIVPAGPNGTVSAFVTNRTHLVLDTNGYFAP